MANRLQIAQSAAADFYAAESAIDDALHRTAHLLARLPELRKEARLSAIVGQDVFDAVARASLALTAARGSVVDGHQAIDKVRGDLRIPPLKLAPSGDKPDGDFAWTAPLAIVNGEAA